MMRNPGNKSTYYWQKKCLNLIRQRPNQIIDIQFDSEINDFTITLNQISYGCLYFLSQDMGIEKAYRFLKTYGGRYKGSVRICSPCYNPSTDLMVETGKIRELVS
jgi:hypothetical protein